MKRKGSFANAKEASVNATAAVVLLESGQNIRK